MATQVVRVSGPIAADLERYRSMLKEADEQGGKCVSILFEMIHGLRDTPTKITTEHVSAVREMKAEVVQLSFSECLTDLSFDLPHGFPANVRNIELYFDWVCQIDPKLIRAAASTRQLKVFSLGCGEDYQYQVDTSLLEGLAQCSELHELSLRCTLIGDVSFLSKASSLRDVTLCSTQDLWSSISSVSQVPSLERLHCRVFYRGIGATPVSPPLACERLRELSIETDEPARESVWEWVGQCRSIEKLVYEHGIVKEQEAIPSSCFERLSQLTNLKEFCLQSSSPQLRVQGNSILSEVRRLSLGRSHRCTGILGHFPSVESLVGYLLELVDDDCLQIHRLSKLRSIMCKSLKFSPDCPFVFETVGRLTLHYGRISDTTITSLNRFPNLRELMLIGMEDPDQKLQSLRLKPQLGTVIILPYHGYFMREAQDQRPRITESDARTFAKVHPKVKVYFDVQLRHSAYEPDGHTLWEGLLSLEGLEQL